MQKQQYSLAWKMKNESMIVTEFHAETEKQVIAFIEKEESKGEKVCFSIVPRPNRMGYWNPIDMIHHNIPKDYQEYTERTFFKRTKRDDKAKVPKNFSLAVVQVRVEDIDIEVESYNNHKDFFKGLQEAIRMYVKDYIVEEFDEIVFYTTLEEDGLYRFYTKEDYHFDYEKLSILFPEEFPNPTPVLQSKEEKEER